MNQLNETKPEQIKKMKCSRCDNHVIVEPIDPRFDKLILDFDKRILERDNDLFTPDNGLFTPDAELEAIDRALETNFITDFAELARPERPVFIDNLNEIYVEEFDADKLDADELIREIFVKCCDKNQEEDEEEEVSLDQESDASLDQEEEVSYFNSNVSIYSPEELEKLYEFANDTELTLIDAMEYIKDCHNCGKTLQIFGNMYCNKRGCEYVEDYRYPCYKDKDCLICHGYPKENIEKQYNCFWGEDCDKCKAYDGKEEDRFFLNCVVCVKPMTEHEGYMFNGTDLICNLCAVNEEENQVTARENEDNYFKIQNEDNYYNQDEYGDNQDEYGDEEDRRNWEIENQLGHDE